MTRKLLFDLRSAQFSRESAFHGGREHCEAILEGVAHRLPPGQVVAYCDPCNGIPERTRELIDCRKVQLIPVRSSSELEHKLGNVSFRSHFRCVPPPREPMHRYSSERTVCVAFGFRTVEMPTDSIEWYYSKTPSRFCKFIIKSCLRSVHRRRCTAQWRRFFSESTLDKVVTISDHSKYVLRAFAGDLVDADSVLTLYPPSPIAVPPGPLDFAAWGIARRRYFLLVSANRWIKNAVRAVQALDWVYTMHPSLDIKTVVLGCPAEGAFMAPVRNQRQFLFRPYIPHDELQALYANAFAFIYPTMNEGFGYPPLDAMRYGTPVLASAISSVPEACGDAASYFSPFSVREMAARILQVAFSPQYRADLSERGRARFVVMQAIQQRDRDSLIDILTN